MGLGDPLSGYVEGRSAAARRALLRRFPELLAEESVEALKRETEARLRSSIAGAERSARAARELAAAIGTRTARARALLAHGFVRHGRDRYAEAAALYREARALFLAAGDRESADRALLPLIDALAQLARDREARAVAARARRAFLARGDRRWAAMVDMNLGSAHHRAGRFGPALRCLDRAAAFLEAAGARAGAAVNDVNRANVLSLLGRGDEALVLYAHAAAHFREQGREGAAARADYNAATARFVGGDFAGALAALARVEEAFAREGDRRHLALAGLDRAEILLRLGNREAAGDEARRAARSFRALSLPGEAALAEGLAAIASAEAGRPGPARRRVAAAAAALDRAGWHASAASHRLHEAALALAAGDPSGARDLLRGALPLLARAGLPDRVALGHLLRARTAAALGRPAEARRGFAQTIAGLAGLPLPWITWRARHGLARLAAAAGDLRAAEKHFAAAVRDLEAVRDALAGDEVRGGLSEDGVPLYDDYVRFLLAGKGARRAERAFALLERARARTLPAGVAAFPPAARALKDPRVAAAMEELRRLEARVAAALHGARDPGARGPAPAALRATDLRAADHRARALAARVEAAVGPGALPGRPEVPPVRSLTECLLPDEAILSYADLDGRLAAFILDAGGLSGPHDLGPVAAAETLAADLRSDLTAPPVHPAFAESARRAAERRLASLGDLLIRPLRSRLPAGPLRVIPRGGLHGVPFHALLLDGALLGESREVSVLPSAGSFWIARSRRVRGTGPPAVLGIPDERAPRVRDECAEIAALYPDAEVVCGPQADSRRLRDAAARGARILHVATHGLFRPEVPRLAAFLLGDGWFGLGEAYGLSLSADLVFLSSCDGGLGGALRSGESIGLARALLLAGAGALVGALGPVRDEAAAAFTGAFYRALAAGSSIGEAHEAALRRTRERFPHPADFALFTLHGDGALRPTGDHP